MYPSIQKYCETLTGNFGLIDEDRKKLLKKLSLHIINKQSKALPVNLVYICTHNSRRSHFGQVWATVASQYYKIKKIRSFSGGTEKTAFHPNAMSALQRVGFKLESVTRDKNAVYHVFYDDHEKPIDCFSKRYDDPVNPKNDFAAIMTCGEAEENCPFIPGVDLRIATTYEDPKAFDDTLLQDEMYDLRCRQIALETLYVFYLVGQDLPK